MDSGHTKRSKSAALRAYVEERRPASIGAGEFDELSQRLAPVSEGYLRKLLRETGLPLSPVVEGVRQDSLPELERTLLALELEYREAAAAGDRARAKTVRRAVISAKDHARFTLAKLSGARRAEREEMLLWIMTWLENPGVFPTWLALRKSASHEKEQADHNQAI